MAFSCRSRAVTEKNVQKSVMDVQSCCFACSFQPVTFLTFSSSSPLWHLKVPNVDFFVLSLLVNY